MEKDKNTVQSMKQLLIGLLVGVITFGLFVGVYFVLVEPVLFRDGAEQSLLLSMQEREERKFHVDVGTAGSELLSPTDLENLIRGKSSYIRTTTIHRALANTNVAQLIEFFNKSIEVTDASLLHELQDATIQRLAVVDPEQTISLLGKVSPKRRRVLLTIVFEEWSVADLDQVVKYGLQLDDIDRLAVLDGVFNARFDLSKTELHEIASQLGHKQRMLERLASRQLYEPIQNASDAWHKLLTDYGENPDALSEVQIELLVHIATTWLDRSGVDAVQAIKDSPDYTIKTLVLERMLDSIGDQDPQQAFDLLNGLREIDRGLMTRVIKKWARIDGLAAFNAGAALADVYMRKPVQKDAIEIWGVTDPHSLLAALEKFPDEFDEVKNTAFGHAMRGLARTDPEEALNQLHGLSDEADRARITEIVVEGWSEQDPKAALQWVQYEAVTAEQEFKSNLQSIVLSKLTQSDARSALDLALSLPLADNGIGPENVVISELAKVDVDAALSMLTEVRNQATRESTYVSLGHELIRAGRSSQAIELAKKSSEEVQYGYLMSLTGHWSWREPRDLLNHLEEIPLASVKREAAVGIAMSHKLHVALTKEQRESLKKYIPEFYWNKL
ncbi:MAG: hypothetical protein F4W92_05435 [Gammaproteobacteria bacterium]|nr:hypothetical protein [Gammaproteobacteria bacterium]